MYYSNSGLPTLSTTEGKKVSPITVEGMSKALPKNWSDQSNKIMSSLQQYYHFC